MLLLNLANLLIDTAATFLAAIFLIRFWSQVARVRPPESLVNVTLSATNWFVLPLRKLLPGKTGPDWPCMLGAIVMAFSTAVVAVWGTPYFSPKLVGILALQQFVNWVFFGLMAMLVLEVIFSWINPNAPIAPFIHGMNQPILRPVRKIIPLIGALDLSIFVTIIALNLVMNLIQSGIARLV